MPAQHATPNAPHRQPRKYAAEPFNSVSADYIFLTSDTVEFRVHKQILMMWSAFWQAQFLTIEEDRESEVGRAKFKHDRQGRPIIPVSEDSTTLDLLLRHVYPTDDVPTLSNFWEAFAVLEAARKYEIVSAVKTAKKAIAQLAEVNPLRVYVLAAEKKFPHEMRTAAAAALGHNIAEQYVQELENLPSGTYYRLLAYHRACARAVATRLSDLTWMEEIAERKGWRPGMFKCHDPGCGGMWFSDYISTIRQALRTRPQAKTLEDAALADTALAAGMACRFCRTTALADLRMFNTLLAAEINRALETVRIFPLPHS